MKSRWAWLLALSILATGTPAKEALPNADDPQIERRLLALTADLRCVVCQNESLAESRAPLAKDLRQEVRDLMRQGRSDREVVAYLTDRYGDFVLYRPRMTAGNFLLWAAPVLLLAIGIFAVVRVVRRRAAETDTEPAGPEAGQS